MAKVQKYVRKATSKSRKKVHLSTTYKSKKLGNSFNIKDKIKFEHTHNVVYHAACPNKKCKSQYTRQIKCRIEKSALQKLDKKSHIFKHARKTKHKKVKLFDFTIIGKGYQTTQEEN